VFSTNKLIKEYYVDNLTIFLTSTDHNILDKKKHNIMHKHRLQYPGQTQTTISWTNTDYNILDKGRLQYPGQTQITISWINTDYNILDKHRLQYPG
jgi:hypothetical protein